jgi:indole-3-glycerol phosphate synthase
VQVSRDWTPPTGTLGKILEETRRTLPSFKDGEVPGFGEIVIGPGKPKPRERLGSALLGNTIRVIAELKRRSPSRGALNESLDAPAQAALFEKGGAAAISVLTQGTHFGGSPQDLIAVRQAVRLPILRKDFHIDFTQLVQARLEEASAVLLIARALPPSELPRMMESAQQLDLETVVEVRTEAELQRAVEAGASIVGVNSRDLETLEVDESVPRRLIPQIPKGIIRVWESGVETVDDVKRAADAGADAVLVGSALSRSKHAEAVVRSMSAVPRGSRHG